MNSADRTMLAIVFMVVWFLTGLVAISMIAFATGVW